MQWPEQEWPLQQWQYRLELIQTTTLTNVLQLKCDVVGAKMFTSVRTLKRTLARVPAVFSGTKTSLTRFFENPTIECIEKARTLLLQCEQKVLQDDFQKGKFNNLGAAKKLYNRGRSKGWCGSAIVATVIVI